MVCINKQVPGGHWGSLGNSAGRTQSGPSGGARELGYLSAASHQSLQKGYSWAHKLPRIVIHPLSW